ncbi:hypothetical protein SY88_11295 [Clostridiales bacterium PH28_bin88]|nr:hypothetical protein SY88_11295 [Clostridiales bacterium PH28_bin88]
MRKKRFLVTVSLLLTMGMLLTAVPAFAADATSGVGPWNGLRMGLGRVQGGMLAIIADFLGLEREQVITQRQEGKSMVDIAEAVGVNERQLVDKVVAVRQDNLAQLVEDGRMTQEQADLCNETMQTRIETNLNRTTVGPPWATAGQAFGRGRGDRVMQRGFGTQASQEL